MEIKILALLAIIFAALNIILWLMAWKRSDDAQETSPAGVDDLVIKEIKSKLEEGMERNLRLEDQLWGILDKLKEQEQLLKQFQGNAASQVSGAADDALLDNMETWSLKILKTIKENAAVKDGMQDAEGSTNKIDALHKNVEELNTNFQKLKSYILSKEQ
jgi:hypothetical protein